MQHERRLAQHAEAKVFGQRQDVGQRDRLAGMEQADGETVRRQSGPAADFHVEPGTGQHFLQRLDVGDGLRRIEGLAIDRRKPFTPAAGSGAARGITQLGLQRRAQPVVPRGRGVRQFLLEGGEVGGRRIRLVEFHRVERLGQRRIAADRGRDRGRRAVPGPFEDRCEALAQCCIKALARGEDQVGGEAADDVAAREQRNAAALLQLQDAQHLVVERVLVDLEQLVARVGIEDRRQRLAVVAMGIDAGAAQHARHPASQQRHIGHHRVIGGGGEQAGEAPLAGDAAVGVVGFHDHAIHRPAAMDQRWPVGLHDQYVVGAAGKAGHRLATTQARLEQSRLVAAQDAERRALYQLVAQTARLRGVVDVAIAAVAQEGEVAGFQPLQEILVLLEALRATGRKIGDGVEAGLAHRPPVVDREAHLGQHARERRGEIVELAGPGLAIDLDVHHRFRAACRGTEVEQIAVEVTAHRQHRMGQQMDGDLAAIEFVGDRIDQERHVVVHDVNHGVPALETVAGLGRVEHPDLGDAGQAAAREGQQGKRRSGTLRGRSGRQVLVGDALEQPPCEGSACLAASLEGGDADGIQTVKPRRRCDGHFLAFPPAT